MLFAGRSIPRAIEALRDTLAKVRPTAGTRADAVDRALLHLSAIAFHHARSDRDTPVVVLIGGTGAGKSTIVNRLVGQTIAATSFRRTFTAGAVAIASQVDRVPDRFADLPTRLLAPELLPARGEGDAISIALATSPLIEKVVLVDSPDLDGDVPDHHAIADRLFRFAEAVVFLVTPEKYQMTELWPYYRLAARYGVASRFVMNKIDDPAAPGDYLKQLRDAGLEASHVFEIPRDDATYAPPQTASLGALRDALASLQASPDAKRSGLAARSADLRARVADQIVEPMRADRAAADRAIAGLQAMLLPEPGVDVNSITRDLQRRLQQRSVLYLIGPGRILDRVRQVPGLLLRLPRTAWDLLRRGGAASEDAIPPEQRTLPDFRESLIAQFRLLHSRIDDLLAGAHLPAGPDASWKLPVERAGDVADEELADLRTWLEQRWNATPRDTAALKKLLRLLPGGDRLLKMSEAAPYLLAVACAAHGAIFGHLDIMILGGYGLATWLVERMSNEVASRTRATNRAIARRFAQLAEQQVNRTIDAVRNCVPDVRSIDALESQANDLAAALGGDDRQPEGAR